VTIIRELQIALVCACLLAAGRAGGDTMGTIAADRILYLGNSITFCPQPPDQVEWWGLSASTPATDYVHLLTNKIVAATGKPLTVQIPNPAQNAVKGRWYPSDPLPNYNGNIINICDLFEVNYDTWTNARIQNQLNWNADLVVLQFGENMTGGNLDKFETALRTLLTGLKNSSNPNIFVTSYIMGEPAGVDSIKRRLVAEDPTHRVFVNLSGINADPANFGAYAHPSDQGMAYIANGLFQAMEPHLVPEPSSIVLLGMAAIGLLHYARKKRKDDLTAHS
jgi:hypothetical protein